MSMENCEMGKPQVDIEWKAPGASSRSGSRLSPLCLGILNEKLTLPDSSLDAGVGWNLLGLEACSPTVAAKMPIREVKELTDIERRWLQKRIFSTITTWCFPGGLSGSREEKYAQVPALGFLSAEAGY
ncbi:hypothetical protein Ocin01_17627 [Orchesella cincta]|uniref:Uncharacterized protein n=1 Tax=Orchesella cincta TaxID=48709 RepID=A0A1D2M817_ORCCI|nr:hypothetical protein Ocin01_17627 [Orchesella cincta]